MSFKIINQVKQIIGRFGENRVTSASIFIIEDSVTIQHSNFILTRSTCTLMGSSYRRNGLTRFRNIFLIRYTQHMIVCISPGGICLLFSFLNLSNSCFTHFKACPCYSDLLICWNLWRGWDILLISFIPIGSIRKRHNEGIISLETPTVTFSLNYYRNVFCSLRYRHDYEKLVLFRRIENNSNIMP